MWYTVVIAILVGYMLGNLNGAVCMSALVHDDVRSHGSGNAGLTNFVRNYGAGKAVFVILIDAGKAVLACTAGGLLLQPYLDFTTGAAIGGLSVMLGHIFPALLGFRGGKGILSGLFIAVVVDWRIALIILAVFAVAYFLTQYVSLGSILGATAFAIAFVVLHRDNLTVMLCGIVMGAMTIFMHHGNLARLLKGEERKTNLFKRK
ncbi:MAG: glycerol-3-phosphate acyltransferase [Oscillospiraceae bacterium]|nr:glycerol-3-phosphate acyltransferase [Oscillospiraceae bacterium]